MHKVDDIINYLNNLPMDFLFDINIQLLPGKDIYIYASKHLRIRFILL